VQSATLHFFTGHPLDTIKSKLQIQSKYANMSAFRVANLIWSQDGLIGFFRGCVPPLWGSMIYRGIMMSGYEYSFTFIEKNYDESNFMRKELLLGVRPMVFVSSVFASFSRVILESKHILLT